MSTFSRFPSRLQQAIVSRLGWTSPGRWVDLPGGRFAMGAQKGKRKAPGHDPQVRDNEAPVHTVRVDAFRIARFPVTVAEYAEFLEDDDRADSRWWQAGGSDQPVEPENWEGQQAHPSRPVVEAIRTPRCGPSPLRCGNVAGSRLAPRR